MSPFSSLETQLQRVFDAGGLVFAAEANKADAVVDFLGAVFMTNVQHHVVLSTIKQ